MASVDHKIFQSRFTENRVSPITLTVNGKAGLGSRWYGGNTSGD